MKSRHIGRYAVACALVLAIGIPSVAMGFGEGRTLLLGKRNPSPNASRGLNSETEIIANNSTYGTRQSNKKDGDGGGAIYGCRSNPGNEPCVRANNLKGGRAFEFVTVGKEAGRIETGDANGAPFTTNATGVATGLNAERVGGKTAAQLADAQTLTGKKASDFAAANQLLFAAVAANGTLSAGSGATAATKSATANTYTVTFGRDVSKCSFTASPLGAAAAEAPGVAPTSGNANAVTVDTGAAATSFHLQVICGA